MERMDEKSIDLKEEVGEKYLRERQNARGGYREAIQ
jgi:hypothetical protein